MSVLFGDALWGDKLAKYFRPSLRDHKLDHVPRSAKLSWRSLHHEGILVGEGTKILNLARSCPATLRMHDNSPEDIRDLAQEMLERTDGSIVYTEEDVRLEAQAREVFDSPFSSKSACRAGRAFLRKYQDTIFAPRALRQSEKPAAEEPSQPAAVS